MEREILFRGKRVADEEWVYGYYLYADEDAAPVIIDKHCYSYVIIPETVGQYTGLTDKNGTRIFEGDILSLKHYMINDLVVVKFGKYEDGNIHDDIPCGHVGFYLDFSESFKEKNYYRNDICFFAPKCEVISNVHDNPEMIGDNENA
ncbi:MAG: YopX family protein [Clostridium sp.]|nr:YopX family protein [Clostridium sp.]